MLLLVGATIAASLSRHDPSISGPPVILSDRETLEVEVAKYPCALLREKYGSWVIEIDGRMTFATDAEMTRQINDKINEIDCFTTNAGVLDGCTTAGTATEDEELSIDFCLQEDQRHSSSMAGAESLTPKCFFSSICWVCRRSLQYRPGTSSRGYCIECNLYPGG